MTAGSESPVNDENDFVVLTRLGCSNNPQKICYCQHYANQAKHNPAIRDLLWRKAARFGTELAAENECFVLLQNSCYLSILKS